MARPRLSRAAATLSGRDLINPGRFRDRPLSNQPPLGDPPAWMKPPVAEQWRALSDELPWLDRSHRAITEIASILLAKLAAGTANIACQNLLRMVLGQLCATPTSRTPNQKQPTG
jgi:hypothetical protein